MDILNNIDCFISDSENGMTLKELADKYNCGTTTVSRYKKKLNCKLKVKKGRLNVNCLNCGKEKSITYAVYNYSETKHFFCNCSCNISFNNRKRLKNLHPNYKDTLVSYRDNAYRNLPNICYTCGYDTVSCLVVHHIDEDRDNNDISNLVMLCPNCHREIHKGLRELCI